MALSVDMQKYNDDLLIPQTDQQNPEEDLEHARQHYPRVFHSLQHTELQKLFIEYDELASTAKKRSRRAGILAVGFAVVALLGASAEPLYHDLCAPYPKIVGFMSALAGVASVVIGLWGVLHARSKREWLYNRLMTERLRQFHFQTFVCRLPEIAASLDGGSADYQEERKRWFDAFKGRYVGKLGAEFNSLISGNGGADIWAHERKPATDAIALKRVSAEALQELFGAYRNLRIAHQLQYANYKLRTEGKLLSPPARMQESAFANTSLFCILLLFLIHLLVAIAIGFGQHMPGWVHVAVIWLAILALAVRALEEGLQPGRELERYRHYRSSVQAILDQFDSATSTDQKVRIMEQMERLSFEEMRNFLRTNNEARFVM